MSHAGPDDGQSVGLEWDEPLPAAAAGGAAGGLSGGAAGRRPRGRGHPHRLRAVLRPDRASPQPVQAPDLSLTLTARRACRRRRTPTAGSQFTDAGGRCGRLERYPAGLGRGGRRGAAAPDHRGVGRARGRDHGAGAASRTGAKPARPPPDPAVTPAAGRTRGCCARRDAAAPDASRTRARSGPAGRLGGRGRARRARPLPLTEAAEVTAPGVGRVVRSPRTRSSCTTTTPSTRWSSTRTSTGVDAFDTWVQHGYTSDQSGQHGAAARAPTTAAQRSPDRSSTVDLAALRTSKILERRPQPVRLVLVLVHAADWEVWYTEPASTATRIDHPAGLVRTGRPSSSRPTGNAPGCAEGWAARDVTDLVQAWSDHGDRRRWSIGPQGGERDRQLGLEEVQLGQRRGRHADPVRATATPRRAPATG